MLQLLITFNLIKKIKIFLLFGFIANLLLAQNTFDLNFKNIEPENIGVKAIFTGLYSKKYNFMWLSTNEGLGIYNGFYFRKMINPLDSNNKVLSKPLTSLFEDKDGLLWFGYNDSVGFTNFDYENKRFTHFRPNESNKDVFAREFIPSEFYQDSVGRIWIATWGGGLLQYNKATKKFKRYNTDTKFANGSKIVCGTVRTIFEFEKNKFFICFFQERPAAHPCILDIENNTLTEFPIETYAKNLSPTGLIHLKRYSTIIHKTFYDKKDQKIWLGGYSCVICIDLKNKVSKRISPKQFKQEDELNLDNVNDFIEGNDGNIWATTTNSGIMVIDKKNLNARYHAQNGNCATCIADNSVYKFEKDKNNTIWVFSAGRGISMNTPYSQVVKIKNWNNFDVGYSNSSHQSVPVSQMLAKGDHKLYMSSANGISIYDYQNDSTYPNIKFGKTFYDNQVGTFRFGKKNTIELIRASKKDNQKPQFSIYNEQTKKIVDESTAKHVYAVNFLEDSLDATYAFSLYYTDLFKYNYNTNSFDTFFIFPKEKAPHPTNAIKLKRNKFLFTTYQSGFVLLDAETKKVTTFKPNRGDKYFEDSVIHSVYYNKKNSVWIGTISGLFEFNINTESFVNHTKEINFNKMRVYNVFEDNAGFVWFTNTTELFRYEPTTKRVMVFNKRLGFNNFSFNVLDYKMITAHDGDYLFLPNKKGLTFFNTSELKLPSEKSKISIFEILVNDSIYQEFTTNGIELKHNQNNLTLRLITDQLYTPSAGSFSYSLIGLDDRIKTVKSSEIELQNLPPGTYELKVYYKNAFGIDSDEFTYSIQIHNPFWKSWWFILLSIIIFVLLLFYGMKQREKNLLKKQEYLESVVKERTEELVIRANEIGQQKLIIEEKQKEIVDSILYARRIQNALLASKSLLDKYLKNYFIYFNPKELVSGDFYWATELKNKFYFIIADSTGHGVPGAFMSLLNINFLNEAINEKGIENTDDILNYVRSKLILSLAEDGSQEGGKDGMDCSLLCFDFEKMELQFSCANNPIIIISNGQLTEYKADRMAVGKSPKDEITFSSTKLNLQPGDVIYALTDGFADQFGGPSGKKLKHKNLREYLYKISNKALLEQHDLLGKEFKNWKGNLEQIDDVCIVGVKV